MDSEGFCLMDHWTYYAVLGLLEDEGAQRNSEAIAKRLAISLNRIQLTLDNLLDMNIIQKSKEEYSLIIEKKTFASKKTKKDERSLRKNTLSCLQKSIDVYKDLAFPFGDKAGYICFSVLADPEKIRMANKMLQDYLYKICLFLESSHNKKLFFLNAQLFSS